ncbi:MAG: hypothetical protein R3A13_11320 [Bdellovibrionota bacterium]
MDQLEPININDVSQSSIATDNVDISGNLECPSVAVPAPNPVTFRCFKRWSWD